MKTIKTILLTSLFLFTSCSTTSLEPKDSQSYLSKMYSLEQYKILPEEKRYKGEFSVSDKDFKLLASDKPFKNIDDIPFETKQLSRTRKSILDILHHEHFKKKFKYIFSDDLKVLVYNKQKMILVTWGQSETANTICVGGNKILFEIDKDILKVYFLDYAGGEIAK